MEKLRDLPLFVCFIFATALAMLVPAGAGFGTGDSASGQGFLFAAIVTGICASFVAIATSGRDAARSGRNHLITILASFVCLPAIAAFPVMNAVAGVSFGDAYFEMLSALTTTGATIFDDPGALPLAVNFWRSLVGWLGGFLILLAAFSILEPMRLGGFELQANTFGGRLGNSDIRSRHRGAPMLILRTAAQIWPIYMGATGLLTFLLIVFGEDGFVAMCHAMAILSTSGISPIGGLAEAQSGFAGEVAILLFFGLALTHRAFSDRWRQTTQDRNSIDKEVKLAIIISLSITFLVFARHFALSLDLGAPDPAAALRALWGILFTLVSFLTTTGFESGNWAIVPDWSGASVTGLVLLSVAVIGGGIATTAGGVKLLRVYALYMHGKREMERLVHPSSVGGLGTTARQVRREGAYIAWMFLMIFFLSIGVGAMLLALLGLDFEASLIMTVATLANTGPLIGYFGPDIPRYDALSGDARMVLNGLMVLGRMEALAVIALLNPEYWRR